MSKLALLFLALVAVPGVGRAENDPEYQACTVYGIDVHNFIDCLVTARDGWSRKKTKLYEDVVKKLDYKDDKVKPFRELLSKQVKDLDAKCGDPNPSTIAGAECQRAMKKQQFADLEKAAAPILK